MKQYNKVGNGSLHNNGEVTGKQPPYGGPIEIDGRKLRMSAWIKEKDGKRYFSIEVQEVIEINDHQGTQPSNTRPAIDDSEIPF
tara:strand:- start:1016 stop:1267 length:252 start_codon:yes stop_codon:yes gene_type:complete